VKTALTLLTALLLASPLTALCAADMPQTVTALWADFDPRHDPLEVEVVREWKEDGGVYRYVRYLIGTYKGKAARMAAFYGFPEHAQGRLPAVMHVHGGGQRAFLEEMRTYVGRGYTVLSINWGGRARFWRDAGAKHSGDSWAAKLPVLDPGKPLYAFANVYYTLPHAESLPHMPPINELCLSSLLHHASPAELISAGVRTTDQPARLIDDFTRGWHDWYRLSPDNKACWQNWTRKITDPKWCGPDGAKLAVTLTLQDSNHLSFVMIENEWRNYRGKKKAFISDCTIVGQPQAQTIMLNLSDFKDAQGSSPATWQQMDQLGLCAYYEERERGKRPQSPLWHGSLPEFQRLEWR